MSVTLSDVFSTVYATTRRTAFQEFPFPLTVRNLQVVVTGLC